MQQNKNCRKIHTPAAMTLNTVDAIADRYISQDKIYRQDMDMNQIIPNYKIEEDDTTVMK